MRLWVLMLLMMSLVAGCAAREGSRAARPAGGAMAVDAHGEYEPQVATALAFDPPVAADLGVVELPRGPRASSAFVAFEELQTQFFHIRIDDRQTNDWRERYERRAIIQQSGVRYR